MTEKSIIAAASILGACLTLIVAAFSAAFADAMVARKTIEGMTRQPEAKNALLVNMVIMVGLIESIPIIAAVIAIVLVLANPFLK